MATLAMMSGNIVTNIITADSKDDAELALGCKLIEYTSENPAGIGWTYNEESGRFEPPITQDEVAE